MKVLRIYPTSINGRMIDEAVEAIRRGQTVIFPTDSVYAIGCDALDNNAVERLCALKGINPKRETLSVICSDISMASEYAMIDNRAFAQLRRWLPGAVTFVLPASPRLPKVFKGRRTVGIRIPDSPVALELVSRLGHPLMSTSVVMPDESLLGEPSEIALQYSSSVPLMLDAGGGGSQYSTVVDLTDSSSPEIIRQGKTPFQP